MCFVSKQKSTIFSDTSYYHVTVSYSLPVLHYIPRKMDKEKFELIRDNDEQKRIIGYKVSFELYVSDLAMNPPNMLHRNLYIIKMYTKNTLCAPRITVTNW